MTAEHKIRHYMVLKAADTYARLAAGEASSVRREWDAFLKGHLDKLDLGAASGRVSIRLLRHPGPRWRLVLAGDQAGSAPFEATPSDEYVCAVEITVPSDAGSVHERAHEIRSKLKSSLPGCLHMGTDIAVHGTNYWCPVGGPGWLFGNRNGAAQLIGAPYLHQQEGTTGKGVNVVVVDQGVDREFIPNFGGGWQEDGGPAPGSVKGGHGAMLVRNILDVAPDATIFDFPLIRGTITDSHAFLSEAHQAYREMLNDIAKLRESADWQGPWVFLNAWAVYDRKNEVPWGDHSNGPEHGFNCVISEVVSRGFDVVFCAGNCGQFCPMQLCGDRDRGPGNSILGANSHPKVLTVGAVRVDATWLGYSSQGPGQPDLAEPEQRTMALQKPDLCAPSQFAENGDESKGNTGTSAASAVAAGAIAALRGRWSNTFSPAELKDILVKTARKTEGDAWSGRLGHGILDVAAAYREAAHRSANSTVSA